MSENVVVCCSGPAVAVTVTIEVTGGVVLEDDDLPPQPVNRLSPITLTSSRRSSCKSRLFFQAKKQSTQAKVAAGNNGLEVRRTTAVVAEVVTVSVVVEPEAPDGVMVAGEKAQVAPTGNPAQMNDTLDAKPFIGVTVKVTVPLFPEVTVRDAGEAATVKSDGCTGRVMTYAAETTALLP